MNSLLAYAFFWIAAAQANSPAPATPKATPFAEVVELKGLASLEPKHTNLDIGMELKEGSRITVMSKSMLRIRLSNGAAVQVGPHSELTLKRSEENAPLLLLAHGMVLASVREPEPADPKKRNRLEVRTGRVSVEVHGADFFVRSEGDKAAFVCPCSGGLKARWGKHEAVLRGSGHDNPVSVLPWETKPRAEKSKGPDHNDGDLAELKKLL